MTPVKSTGTKPRAPKQLAMQLAEPGMPSLESYSAVMFAARLVGRRPAQLQQHLEMHLAEGRICRTDAQVIWRGVMWEWPTPFDITF